MLDAHFPTIEMYDTEMHCIVYGLTRKSLAAKSLYKNCLNSQPENDPGDMFLVVCVCICFPPFLWNVKSVGSAYYFQVHYYGTCFHSGLKLLQKVSFHSLKKV